MAEYKIEIKRSAVKELKRLLKNDLQKVLSRIERLSKNPRPADCQKLSSQEKYRIRQGVYRILYSIEDNVLVVYIVKVGHRKNVYR